jgi:histidyl-tRNA synthetase
MSAKIKVEPVSGFPEWLPNLRLAEQRFISTIQKQYELFGFSPIETPAVERLDVLTAKGGMQRQIFSVGKPDEDESKADLGLHFDLTVPLARYVVQHRGELVFPFRRYQIQKVWRGERAQKGRFREFYQCDIDVIGRGKLDVIHDAEIPCVIHSTFEAIQLPEFKVLVSNRKILSELLKTRGIMPGSGTVITGELEKDHFVTILTAVDKTQNHTIEETRVALQEAQTPDDLITAFLDLLQCKTAGDARRVLVDAGASPIGADELETVLNSAKSLGMPDDRIAPNFRIARGLDYYTGTVYETFITGKETWGSVCSGGRYDDLAEYFTTQRFPGVGISIGLTRLFNLLVEAEYVDATIHTPTKVLVTMQDREHYLDDYLGIARRLRQAGVPAEAYLDADPLREQLGYAASKGIRFAVVAGGNELNVVDPLVQLKDLTHKTEVTIPETELLDHIKFRLDEPDRI